MRFIASVCMCLVLGGCASFLHWKDPNVQAVSCGITSAVLPLLEELAVSLGVPLAAVERLYATACAEAAAKGLSQHDAESYGVAEARTNALRMRAEGKL